nr:hypothetical protein [Tanacetum cinerariifolium]
MLQARENLMQYIQTFLKKFNRIFFRETPKVLTQVWDNFFEIQHAQPKNTHELLRKILEDLQIINKELAEYINSLRRNRPAFYDDDDDEYSIQFSEKSPIAITPVLPTEESENSLSMGDEHLDTILKMKSDEIDCLLEEFTGEFVYIDPIPSGIDGTDYDPKEDIRFIEQLLYDDTSSEDDYFEDIDYVEASPPDFELFILEEVKDEILHVKLLNIHLLIDKIESLNNNPASDYVLKSPSSSFLSYSDNSLAEFETFSDHTEETSSSSTTTHADNSLPVYDSFLFEVEPDQGELSSVAMEAILGEPRVYVPNVLPTYPILYEDSVLKFLFLSELKTRFLIQGYSLKSNPIDFYHERNFLSHSSVILFIQCLTLCSCFHQKTRRKCSNLVKWIENGAKTGIYGFVAIKSA